MFPRTPALRWPRRPVASAETLAAFRIAVGIALLFSTELHAGSSFADLPAAMRIAPECLGWFVAVSPISQAITDGVGKELTKRLRGEVMKVRQQIQGDIVRVSATSRDDLQAVMAALRDSDYVVPLQFVNFR